MNESERGTWRKSAASFFSSEIWNGVKRISLMVQLVREFCCGLFPCSQREPMYSRWDVIDNTMPPRFYTVPSPELHAMPPKPCLLLCRMNTVHYCTLIMIISTSLSHQSPHAVPRSTTQYHAVPRSTTQYHAVPRSTTHARSVISFSLLFPSPYVSNLIFCYLILALRRHEAYEAYGALNHAERSVASAWF